MKKTNSLLFFALLLYSFNLFAQEKTAIKVEKNTLVFRSFSEFINTYDLLKASYEKHIADFRATLEREGYKGDLDSIAVVKKFDVEKPVKSFERQFPLFKSARLALEPQMKKWLAQDRLTEQTHPSGNYPDLFFQALINENGDVIIEGKKVNMKHRTTIPGNQKAVVSACSPSYSFANTWHVGNKKYFRGKLSVYPTVGNSTMISSETWAYRRLLGSWVLAVLTDVSACKSGDVFRPDCISKVKIENSCKNFWGYVVNTQVITASVYSKPFANLLHSKHTVWGTAQTIDF